MKTIPITPRLEYVRTFLITACFDILTPERRFQLIPFDGAQLLDVAFSLNTAPSSLPVNTATEYRYPDGIQISVHFFEGTEEKTVNITTDLLNKLRTALDSLDQTMLRRKYKDGMDATASTLVPIWRESEISIASAHHAIDERLAVLPLSSQLTSFGTRSPETLAGALALANYLYTFIPLPPISIGEILAKRGIEIQAVFEPSIVITHGKVPIVGGVVNVLLEAIYHNELIDEFNRLEGQIKTRLLEIHRKLADDGPIVQNVTLTNNNVAALVRQLNDFEAALQDQGVQIQSITRSNAATMTTLNSRMDKIEERLKKIGGQVTQ